jgi:endonuclease YncB( thermonuclease family)
MSALIGKAGLYLGLVAVCLIALAVVARNWSCRKHPDPLPIRHGPYQVKAVISGALIRVGAGVRDHKDRDVLLTGIAAPAIGEPLAEESRANLEQQAGDQIWVEREGAVIKSHRIEGVIYGESGEHLQIAQLREGLARTTPAGDTIKAYRNAQAEAKKGHRGIWAAAAEDGVLNSKP